MIVGSVTSAREAVVRLYVGGSSGQAIKIDSVIDTGFTGFLTLPMRDIASLELSYAGATQVTLADNRPMPMDAYEGIVRWIGRDREALILAAEGAPLVGMALLSGHRLTLDVEDGGPVRIEALP